MYISSWTWALAVLLWFGPATATAQTYVIKLNSKQTIGRTVTIRDTRTENGTLKFFFPDGKLAHEVPPKSRELIYTVTPLEEERSDRQSGKCKFVYEKATETIGGKTRNLSYHGRTLIFAQKDGVYRVGVVGEQPLDPADVDELLAKANRKSSDRDDDRAFLPAKPVAVGDSWSVDPNVVFSAFKEFDPDMKVSRADGKLVRVYTRGASRFGTLEVSVEGAVKSLGMGSKFDPPAIKKMKVTTDRAIDGSEAALTVTDDGDIKGRGTVRKGETIFTVEMGMGQSSRQEISAERDDPKAREVPVVKFVGRGDWFEFTSKEGRFTASFPDKPTVKTVSLENGVQETKVMAIREQDRTAYGVTIHDYPESAPLSEPEVALKRIAETHADKTKEKKDIERFGYPGIELHLEFEQDGVRLIMTLQAFCVDGRFYQVVAMGEHGTKKKIEVRKFLDSFRLLKEKDGAEPKPESKK
jgi:hypothetical protein